MNLTKRILEFVKPLTTDAMLLLYKFQGLALTFANAVLAAVLSRWDFGFRI